MIIGVLLGVIVGVLLGSKSAYFKPFGTIFLGLLNMLVVLLVFSSMTVGVTSINDIRKLGRVGLKTLFFFLWTTILAIALGLIAAKIINPGHGALLTCGIIKVKSCTPPNVVETFMGLVPVNPINSLASGNILQVIVFSIFLGLGINFAGEKGKPVARVLESLSSVMFSITGMVMKLAPYGVFAIIAWVAGTFGTSMLFCLFKLVMTHYLVCIFHLIFVYFGIIAFLARLRVVPFVKGMTDAITLAASTTSSSATLPATLHCAEENLGVSKNIASFIIPLGTTINMNGTAIFQGISAVFISQVYGVELSWYSLLMIVITGTLSAVGCAGVPGGALVTLSIVLTSVGLPLEGIAIVASIDRLRDIIGTVVNVLGDAVAAVYVAKTEGELDVEKYNNEIYVSYDQKT